MWVKGGGRDAGFGFGSFIGELGNEWRDYIPVGKWRNMHHKLIVRLLSGLKDLATR